MNRDMKQVMFKTQPAVFYRDLNHEAQPSGFRPDEKRAASFFKRRQKHSWKSVCQESL